KRGALVTAANWQVVLVQFVADTLFKTLVAVPVVGGLVLVALVVGGNPLELVRFDDLTQTISAMVGVLLAQPFALAAFAIALGTIVAGGSTMMFAVKAGTVTVLLAGDRPARSNCRRCACPRCAKRTRPTSSASRPACGRCFFATCVSASC